MRAIALHPLERAQDQVSLHLPNGDRRGSLRIADYRTDDYGTEALRQLPTLRCDVLWLQQRAIR